MVYGQAGRGPGQKAAEAGAGAGGEVEKGGACLKPTPATILSSGQQQLEGRTLAGGNKVVSLLGPEPAFPSAPQPDNCLSGALRLEDRKLMLDCRGVRAKLPMVA